MAIMKREHKNKVKRIAWFFGIYFVLALFLCALLIVAGIPQWLNMLIIVVMGGLMYLLFLFICGKIDKKREEEEKEKTKEFDPFAD